MMAYAIELACDDVKRYLKDGHHPFPPVEENNGFRDMTPKEIYYFAFSHYRSLINHEYNVSAMGN